MIYESSHSAHSALTPEGLILLAEPVTYTAIGRAVVTEGLQVSPILLSEEMPPSLPAEHVADAPEVQDMASYPEIGLSEAERADVSTLVSAVEAVGLWGKFPAGTQLRRKGDPADVLVVNHPGRGDFDEYGDMTREVSDLYVPMRNEMVRTMERNQESAPHYLVLDVAGEPGNESMILNFMADTTFLDSYGRPAYFIQACCTLPLADGMRLFKMIKNNTDVAEAFFQGTFAGLEQSPGNPGVGRRISDKIAVIDKEVMRNTGVGYADAIIHEGSYSRPFGVAPSRY